jgi:hypothetical protein
MIKYQYAYKNLGELINIIELERSILVKNDKFTCLSCNSELIPRLGQKRLKHFAHKKNSLCLGETYLHNLAKILFYREYKKCITENEPFNIEVKQTKYCTRRLNELGIKCNLGEHLIRHDLTKYFWKVELEKQDLTFRPDIRLINRAGDDKLFIEIAVTHYIEEKKISTGIRLIEIEINEEKDLQPILDHFLSATNSKISFLNFKNTENSGNHCNNSCKNIFDFFIVDNTGRCLLLEKSLSQISTYLESKNHLVLHSDISESWRLPGSKYRYLIAKYFKVDNRVKNCYICRYHTDNEFTKEQGNPIFCKFLKTIGNSNQAVDCKYFKSENEYLDDYIENGKYLEQQFKEYGPFKDVY